MSTISASTTSTTAYKVTADTTGTLVLQTGSGPTTAVTVGTDQSVAFAGAVSTAGNQTVTGSLSVTGSVSAPNTFGFKNRIINGTMVIDQRNAGASQTITGGASTLAFNCDRWQVRSAGANATVQQVATNNTYRMVFTGAASVSAVAAQQSIEALNCVDLAGQNVTLSLIAKSTSLTSLTLEAYYANTTNTFGTWGSPTVTSIGTQAVTISTTESTVSWTFAVPAAATTGLQIRITGGSLAATQTLTIGNVQLEKGSTATSFDYRPYGTELSLCQRYFYKASIFNANATAVYLGYFGGTNGVYELFFPVTMRTTPTATISQPTQVQVYYTLGWTNVTIAVSAYNESRSCLVYVPSDHGNNKLLQLSGGSTVPTASVTAEL